MLLFLLFADSLQKLFLKVFVIFFDKLFVELIPLCFHSLPINAFAFLFCLQPTRTWSGNSSSVKVKFFTVAAILVCEYATGKKRLHLQNKRSVTDDVVKIKLQHFILIAVPHINVVTGRGQLKQSQHRLTMSWCRGTQREYSSKLLIALLNVFQ